MLYDAPRMKRSAVIAVCALGLIGASVPPHPGPLPQGEGEGTAAAPALPPETRAAAVRLREQAFAGTRAAEWARGLSDRAGPRLAGSPGDREAVAWALETLKAQGFSNVRAEKVKVPVWQRGVETGEVTAPYQQKLILTALGGSVATPEGGLEAEILEADSFEALEARREDVRGKIVFFNKRMERTADGSGYGPAVVFRSNGPVRAGKLGAVGVLIRSVGTGDNRLPHTGGTRYAPDVPKIPAAALAGPDADLLERLGKLGKPVRVRFTLTPRQLPEAESANVIGEIRGRGPGGLGDRKVRRGKDPEEIVLLGAHLDSWDLGTGAVDDAAGCAIVIEAARLIGQVRARPRRTIRVVLFAAEENSLAGATAYAEEHAAELPRHAAALEADSGSGRPVGLTWNAGPSAEPALKDIASILEPLGADGLLSEGLGGADISRLITAGVPLFGLDQDRSRYFDYHHTANDTFDKIEPESLDRAVAAVAVFAYCAAEVAEPFEKIPADKRKLPRF